ncbi:hypothetical protein A3B48_02365 [Candidatus Gottesmanbacteria bacterium RIFCSPLOWO2_01_FULL_40_10]|nr:MAG: hypothetical protein A3B48_02365 [Candidatus Gottesmanbacteria bacterium RIFCSPLOWO2_01_FULL_40_10]
MFEKTPLPLFNRLILRRIRETKEQQEIASALLRQILIGFKNIDAYETNKGKVGEISYTREQNIRIDEITSLSLISTLPNSYTYTEDVLFTNNIREKTVKHKQSSEYRFGDNYRDDDGNEHSEIFTFTVKTGKFSFSKISLTANEMIIPNILVDAMHEGTLGLYIPANDPIDQNQIPERIQNALAYLPKNNRELNNT